MDDQTLTPTFVAECLVFLKHQAFRFVLPLPERYLRIEKKVVMTNGTTILSAV